MIIYIYTIIYIYNINIIISSTINQGIHLAISTNLAVVQNSGPGTMPCDFQTRNVNSRRVTWKKIRTANPTVDWKDHGDFIIRSWIFRLEMYNNYHFYSPLLIRLGISTFRFQICWLWYSVTTLTVDRRENGDITLAIDTIYSLDKTTYTKWEGWCRYSFLS